MRASSEWAYRLVVLAFVGSSGCAEEPKAGATDDPEVRPATGESANGRMEADEPVVSHGQEQSGSGGGEASPPAGVSSDVTGPDFGDGGAVPSEGRFVFSDERGARVTFTTYEAEAMDVTGQVLAASRDFGEVAAEASGRQAVRLSATGESVQFENRFSANAIVVRYSIPDSGPDFWTTLTVRVDGEVRAKLDVTSRFSWSYRNDEDTIFNRPAQNDPGAGTAHHFFDEARALIGEVPIGARVEVVKAAGDNASHYDIDLVELEWAPEPLPQPIGYRHLVNDCGATDNGWEDDDTEAFQDCLDAPGAGIYIPPGIFVIKSAALQVNRTTIRGAGMWHSTIGGPLAHFACWNGACEYYDFAVFGDTTARDDYDGEVAFDGLDNSDVILERIWVEHRRVGYWTTGGARNMAIRDSRFRNLHADAVNFYGGAINSVMENCHVRNTGDDAIAAWAHSERSNNTGVVIRNNFIQMPWKANCIGIYGGDSVTVEKNVCVETLQYPGLMVANHFDSHPFSGTNLLRENTLIRAGGFTYGMRQGAFKILAAHGPVDHITVEQLDIVDPTFSGIHIQGAGYVGYTTLSGVMIQGAPQSAFYLTSNSKGALDAVGVIHTSGSQGIETEDGSQFSVNRVGGENAGW